MPMRLKDKYIINFNALHIMHLCQIDPWWGGRGFHVSNTNYDEIFLLIFFVFYHHLGSRSNFFYCIYSYSTSLLSKTVISKGLLRV